MVAVQRDTRDARSQHAVCRPRARGWKRRRRGRGAIRSCRASTLYKKIKNTNKEPPMSSPAFVLSIPSSVFLHRRCAALTFGSLQELLAGSLPGISQLLFSPGMRAPFLALFSRQPPSCLSPAAQLLLLFPALYLLLCERGGPVHVCLCARVCVRERWREGDMEGERESVRVGE